MPNLPRGLPFSSRSACGGSLMVGRWSARWVYDSSAMPSTVGSGAVRGGRGRMWASSSTSW